MNSEHAQEQSLTNIRLKTGSISLFPSVWLPKMKQAERRKRRRWMKVKIMTELFQNMPIFRREHPRTALDLILCSNKAGISKACFSYSCVGRSGAARNMVFQDFLEPCKICTTGSARSINRMSLSTRVRHRLGIGLSSSRYSRN